MLFPYEECFYPSVCPASGNCVLPVFGLSSWLDTSSFLQHTASDHYSLRIIIEFDYKAEDSNISNK